MTVAKIFRDIIPKNLINDICEFYNKEPAQSAETDIVNKNLEYHIPENFIYTALKPYMDVVVGPDHEFSTGSYKASKKPYIIHVDSRVQHDKYGCMSFDSGVVKDNKAVLIPLVEGPEFRTVGFKYWSDYNPNRKDVQNARSNKNHLLKEDFTHDPLFDDINFLDIDFDYEWKLGDVLVWDRNQWHMSSNFLNFNKTKTFLVLFMA